MGGALTASQFDAGGIAGAIHAGRARIEELGGARPGDKTMIDAVVPFDDEFRRSVERGTDIPSALRSAAGAAARAAESTAALAPRLGRARPLAERSVGHPDPGAVSFAIIVAALDPSTARGSSTALDSSTALGPSEDATDSKEV
jgi:dihydroxyacetone kinase